MNAPVVAPKEPDALYSYPLFAEGFAAFLRHCPHVWRMRRTDRYTPIDSDLAEHYASVQGAISAELVNGFLSKYGQGFKLPMDLRKDGEELTLVVPAESQPKRLMLAFSVRDEGGRALPLLPREIGAHVAALDLQTVLYEKASITPAKADRDQIARVRLLLAAIAFQNPHRLAIRIGKEWRRHKIRRWKTPQFREDYGLRRGDLEAWIRSEAEFTVPGSGEKVLGVLKQLLDELEVERTEPEPDDFSRDVRPDGLRYFPTLRSMILHGVQDLMKVVIQAESAYPDGERRATLVRDADVVVAALEDALKGFPLLDALLAAQPKNDKSAVAELARHFDRWTAYVVRSVRLGVPFIIKTDQIAPLIRSKHWPRLLRPLEKLWLLYRTNHDYPLFAKDALGVHTEIVIPAPELAFGKKVLVGQQRGKGRLKPRPDVFGHQLAMPGRRIHLYSSRRPEETSLLEPLDDVRTHTYARVRIKMIRPVLFGYACAAALFFLAAMSIAWVTTYVLANGKSIEHMEAYVTLGALAVTFGILLTAVQHPNPIAHQKVWWARYTIAISAVITIGFLAAYAIERAPT